MINFWWIGFSVGILFLLALDLGIFNRKTHVIKMKEALLWSGFWIFLALVFNVFVYFYYGHQAGFEFLTAYFIEKSLSIDNLFVFVMIFSYFKIPQEFQHKVLFWGIIGALVMRFIFIMAGVALINQFHWVIYLFGFMLLYSAYKMLKEHDKNINLENNRIIRIVKKFFPVTNRLDEGKFFYKKQNITIVTPLFIALVLIEFTDVVFAVDSIPAVLSISRDTFIIYSSNIMAILGLRALYFALSSVIIRFQYLHYGLSIILGFVGLKMLMTDIYHIPILYSLGFITIVITLSIIVSLWKSKEIQEIR